MHFWMPTTKGYTVPLGFDERCTVFLDRRSNAWKYVVRKEFSPEFKTVKQAMDSAERRHGFKADRTYVEEDLDPHERFEEFNRRRREEARRAYNRRWDHYQRQYERGKWAGRDDEAEPPKQTNSRTGLWWVEVLQLEGASWSISEVRKAFAKLAMAHHPDKGGDPKEFQRIQEAWEAAQAALDDETPF